MHYYKKNLGDYYKKAGRLTMLQHGSFNLLIDSCYDREKFPTLEEALDWCWASTPEEEQAVQFVLKKFFVLEGDIYVQKRIEEELNQYREKQETNQQVALYREYCKGARRSKQEPVSFEEWKHYVNDSCETRNDSSTSRSPVVEKSQPNHKPITNNHKPITNSNNLSAEPQRTPALELDQPTAIPAKTDPPVIEIPTNRFGTIQEQYPVIQSQVDEWIETYPAVDVMQELREMRQWSIGKPAKRKTLKGMPSFILGWLGREQDKGGRAQAIAPTHGNQQRQPRALQEFTE